MLLLILFITLAISVSFLCSIFEAVLLSITPSYIHNLSESNPKAAKLMKQQKENIDAPLSAILSLNTISHTAGAAGAGAQAVAIWGDSVLAVFSALLTILILLLSEIIPKTIGANYWRSLAPGVSFLVNILMKISAPLVWLSAFVTKLFAKKEQDDFIRQDLSALAKIGRDSGELSEHEAHIFTQIVAAKGLLVKEIMTPRTVITSCSQDLTCQEFIEADNTSFSRIPIYNDEADDLQGFVVRTDVLLAPPQTPLKQLKQSALVLSESATLLPTFERMITKQNQFALVVDEYGSVLGIVTLEDVIESMFGLEIIDSKDKVENMQRLARQLWKSRMKQKGIILSDD